MFVVPYLPVRDPFLLFWLNQRMNVAPPSRMNPICDQPL
jgi:hypothetical protein